MVRDDSLCRADEKRRPPVSMLLHGLPLARLAATLLGPVFIVRPATASPWELASRRTGRAAPQQARNHPGQRGQAARDLPRMRGRPTRRATVGGHVQQHDGIVEFATFAQAKGLSHRASNGCATRTMAGSLVPGRRMTCTCAKKPASRGQPAPHPQPGAGARQVPRHGNTNDTRCDEDNPRGDSAPHADGWLTAVKRQAKAPWRGGWVARCTHAAETGTRCRQSVLRPQAAFGLA
jgi:hypothetical protein